MSHKAFTVFQDTPSSEKLQAKVIRTNAIATRSLTNNNVSSSNTSATTSTPDLDKENYDPVTGEHAGPGGHTAGKKRKTGVLATKAQRLTDKGSQPEKKKRKPSPPTSHSAEAKAAKKTLKASGNSRKSKRTGSRKVSPMPKLPEEVEVGKAIVPATQREIDSRCKELTLKPLADISEAYDELSVLCPSPSSGIQGSEAMLGNRAVKAPSVEPEIRDYFEPSGCLSASASTRLNPLSEDVPELRTFSTPERKRIYAAFTFSSPSGPSLLASKSSCDDDISFSSTQISLRHSHA